MTDTDRSHRPFRLADLFLLTVGFGIGFAMFSIVRAEAIRRGKLELPEDVGSHSLYHAGPVELLVTALSLGVAAAFPLVRLREAWLEPESRKFRVTDAVGVPPILLASLSALHAARQPSLDPTWLTIALIIAFLVFALAMLLWIPIVLWFLSGLPTPTNWVEYLGLAAMLMNGLVLLHAFAR